MRHVITDILIIGAGPAGLAAALYASRAGRKTVVLEGRASTRMNIGYQIENYPGFSSIDSRELLKKFREQAASFGAEFIGGDALSLSLSDETKYVTTSEVMFEARAVILAMGRPMAKDKLIPGEERLAGLGVSYCAVCDGPLYRGLEVAAVGVSPEAVEDILALQAMGCRVHWFTGKLAKDSPPPDSWLKARQQGVSVHGGVEIRAILGEETVEKVAYAAETGEGTLALSGVFIFREVPTGPLLAQAGVKIDHRQCLAVDRHQRTNFEGVFAAGDLTCGGLQVVTAAGEGCVAALGAIAHIRKLAGP